MCIFGLLNVQQKHEHVIVKQIKLMKAISSNTLTWCRSQTKPKWSENRNNVKTNKKKDVKNNHDDVSY